MARDPVFTRRLADRTIAPIGFGAMGLSFSGRPSPDEAIGLVRLACEAGVGVIDTAEAYCATSDEAGHNERLIRKALAPIPEHDRPVVATKGGQFRAKDGSFRLCGLPDYLRRACERSLRNLGSDVIDLYYLHWPDPEVPLADSVFALAEMRRAGLIRHIGLCNVSVCQLQAMQAIADVESVQAPLSADRLDTLALAQAADELGIAFLAYWPLGGRRQAASLGQRHPVFAQVAFRHGVSAQRVCLAWLLTLSGLVLPIPGARRPATLLDSVAAGTLTLTDADLAAIRAALTAP